MKEVIPPVIAIFAVIAFFVYCCDASQKDYALKTQRRAEYIKRVKASCKNPVLRDTRQSRYGPELYYFYRCDDGRIIFVDISPNIMGAKDGLVEDR